MPRFTPPLLVLLLSVLTACTDKADQPTALQPDAPVLDLHATDSPPRCSIGDAQAAFEAYYPGIYAVNRFEIVDDEIVWTDERNGALGDGIIHCQYRLLASAVPYLADSYEFCAGDIFLGGNQHSFPYEFPEAQAYLDFYYPDIEGAYREKAIAHLLRRRDEVILVRQTYFDALGTERNIGDGGPEDPARTDPTAGDLKPQDMVATAFRDFYQNGPASDEPEKVVTRQWAFFGKLEAGTYLSIWRAYFDEVLFAEYPPVKLVILPCEG